MTNNLSLQQDFAVNLIQESYAYEWDSSNIDTEFDINELFCGLDDLTQIDLPSTSTSTVEHELQSITSLCVESKDAKRLPRIKKPVTLHYCDYCEFSSKSSFNLKRHMIRVHLNIYSFPCDICDQHFKDSDTLNQHKIQVHLPLQARFQCTECDKKFKRKHDMERHIQMVHNRQHAFICPYCASNFTSASNCQRHIKSRCELRPPNLNDKPLNI